MDFNKNIQKLVDDNLGMIYSIAKKYVLPGIELNDLVSEGKIALIKATENYDPNKGKFTTYAYSKITNGIKNFLYENTSLSAPRNVVRDALKFIYKLKHLGIDKNKYTQEELSKITNCSVNNVKIYLRILEPIVYLNEEVTIIESGKEYKEELMDLIPDYYNFEEDVIEKVDIDAAIFNNKQLTEKQKQTLFYKYGFDGSEERTLMITGEILGVSAECIRKSQEFSLSKIKRKLKNTDYAKNRIK